MNVARLNFCLSHEDPDIIRKGITAFTQQILEEHNAVSHFGYHGRGVRLFKASDSSSEASIHANATTELPDKVVGVLDAYIRSSPKLEPFFVVWELTQLHPEDRDLTMVHAQCMAAIIHCASRSRSAFCTAITNRILFERHRAVYQQLTTTGHPGLLHATLGLLLALARSSQSSCRDVYQKFVSQNLPILSTLSQKGKTVQWKLQANGKGTVVIKDKDTEEETPEQHDNGLGMVSTDSRYLIIALLHVLLQSEDQEVVSDCLGADSLLRKVLHSLHRDTYETAAATLRMLHHLLSLKTNPLMSARIPVLDQSFLKGLLALYVPTDNSSDLLQDAHPLLLTLVDVLAAQAPRNTYHSSNNSNNMNSLERFVSLLDSASLPKHAELQARALSHRPECMRVCIGSILHTWEPEVSHKFVRSVSHLVRLVTQINPALLTRILQSVKQRKSGNSSIARSGASFSASLADLAKDVHAHQILERERESVELSAARAVSDALSYLLPKALSKRDVQKMLTHSNEYIQRLGLLFVRGALVALRSALLPITSVHTSGVLEVAIGNALAEKLPDIPALLQIRNRLWAQISASHSNAAAEKEGGKSKKRSNTVETDRAVYLLGLTHDLLGAYTDVSPAAVRVSAPDLLRLVADMVPWDTGASASQAMLSLPVSSTHIDVMLQTLGLLHRAVALKCVRLLGTADEISRNMQSILQNNKWNVAGKPSNLARLLLLACNPTALSAFAQVSAAAHALLSLALTHPGNGPFPVSMTAEVNLWISVAGTNIQEHSIEIVDILIRAGEHWGPALAVQASSAVATEVQVSTVTCTAIAITASQFAVIAPHLATGVINGTPAALMLMLEKVVTHTTLMSAQMTGEMLGKYGQTVHALSLHWGKGWAAASEVHALLVQCSGGEADESVSKTQKVTATAATAAGVPDSWMCPPVILKFADLVLTNISSKGKTTGNATSALNSIVSQEQLPYCWYLISLVLLRHSPHAESLKWLALHISSIAESKIKSGSESILGQQCRHLLSLIAALLPASVAAVAESRSVGLGQKRKTRGKYSVTDALQSLNSAGTRVTRTRSGSSLSQQSEVSASGDEEISKTSGIGGPGEGDLSAAALGTAASLLQLHAKCEWKVNAGSAQDSSNTNAASFLSFSSSVAAAANSAKVATLIACASAAACIAHGVHLQCGLYSTIVAAIPADAMAAIDTQPGLLALGLLLLRLKDSTSSASDDDAYSVAVSSLRAATVHKLASDGSSLHVLGADVARLLRSLPPAVVSNMFSNSPDSATSLVIKAAEDGSFSWLCDPLAAQSSETLHKLLLPAATAESLTAIKPADAWRLPALQAARLVPTHAHLACGIEFSTLWSAAMDNQVSTQKSKTANVTATVQSIASASAHAPAPALVLLYLSTLPLPGVQLALLSWEYASFAAAETLLAPVLPSTRGALFSVFPQKTTISLVQSLITALPAPGSVPALPISLIAALLTSHIGSTGAESDADLFCSSSFVENVVGLLAQSTERVRTLALDGPLPLLVLRGALRFNATQTGGGKFATHAADKWAALWAALVSLQDTIASDVLTSGDEDADINVAINALLHMALLVDLHTDAMKAISQQGDGGAPELLASLSEESSAAASVISNLLKVACENIQIPALLTAVTNLTQSMLRSSLMASVSKGPFARELIHNIADHDDIAELIDRISVKELLVVLAAVGLKEKKIGSMDTDGEGGCASGSDSDSDSGNDEDDEEDEENTLQPLALLLASKYLGTLSYSDRLVARIIALFSAAKVGLPLHDLVRVSWESNLTTSNNSKNKQVLTLHAAGLAPTLAKFPSWRSLIPQPFVCEGKSSAQRYIRRVKKQYRLALKGWETAATGHEAPSGAAGAGAGPASTSVAAAVEEDAEGMDDEASSEDDVDDNDPEGIVLNKPNSAGEDENADVAAMDVQDIDEEAGNDADADGEGEDDDIFSTSKAGLESPCVDSLGSDSIGSTHAYDPAFWLPAIHSVLHRTEPSVRRLANTGVLALPLAALSCSCPLLRACAMACLARITVLANAQTPKVDISFRERPLLLQLLAFARNSLLAPAVNAAIDSDTDPAISNAIISIGNSIPKMPTTSATFLARASQILMQVSHELYSNIGRYLLSRPWCDHKDIPLYDVLISGGAGEGRLSVLRGVRDSLIAKSDHLCLCRKNAYQRLLASFTPLSHGDPRLGHVILDIIERGMALPQGSRYLLQRCGLVWWLRQTGSALAARGSGDRETDSAAGATYASRLAASPKLLPRILQLLRRCVAAAMLLQRTVNAQSLVPELTACAVALCKDIASAGSAHAAASGTTRPSRESLRQLVLLMWDVSLLRTTSSQQNASNMTMTPWNSSLLSELVAAIEVSQGSPVEAKELVLSAAMLPAAHGCYGELNASGADAWKLVHVLVTSLHVTTGTFSVSRVDSSSADATTDIVGAAVASASLSAATYTCQGLEVWQNEKDLTNTLGVDVLGTGADALTRMWDSLGRWDPATSSLPSAGASTDYYRMLMQCRAVCAILHDIPDREQHEVQALAVSRWAIHQYAKLSGTPSSSPSGYAPANDAMRILCAAAESPTRQKYEINVCLAAQSCCAYLAVICGFCISAITITDNHLTKGAMQQAVETLLVAGAVEIDDAICSAYVELSMAVLAATAHTVTRLDNPEKQQKQSQQKHRQLVDYNSLIVSAAEVLRNALPDANSTDSAHSKERNDANSYSWAIAEHEVKTKGFLYDTAPWRRGRLVASNKPKI